MLRDIESPLVRESWERFGRKKVFLCEGDSWFNYPMEDLPFLRIMCLAACVNQKGFLASKAHYGDEIIKMANDQIYDTASFTVGLNAKIQCLFLSGGGNDIVEANMRKYLVVGKESDPGSFIDADKYDKLLKQVLQAYVRIIDMFTGNKKLHCKKVFAHTYDYAIPDGRPFEAFDAFTVTGPWLKPYLAEYKCKSLEAGRAVVKLLIDGFVEGVLETLAAKYPGTFGFSDLRGQLTDVSHWENELHPSVKGWKKISAKFASDFDAFYEG